MLDIKRIRLNPQELRTSLSKRQTDDALLRLDDLLNHDNQRRKLLSEADDLKKQRNDAGKMMGILKKRGASSDETNELTDRMRKLSEEITCIDMQVNALDAEIRFVLEALPNFPHSSIPVDTDLEERTWGEPRSFLWEPKSAKEIGTDLNIWTDQLSEELTLFNRLGARYRRSIINYCLDRFSADGFQETFAADYEKNSHPGILEIYKNSILSTAKLPIRHVSCNSCSANQASALFPPSFEQSQIIQLAVLSSAVQGYDELDRMAACVEQLLQSLSLPYRVSLLCARELPFAASKTLRLEVWIPSLHRYSAVAFCSSNEDYLSRSMEIRFHNHPGEKTQAVHTVVGGIAVAKLMEALFENDQNEDGTVSVSNALIPYMNEYCLR